jgi:hypothetical protein
MSREGSMSPKVMKRVKKLKKLVARGSQYLVLTVPSDRPRNRKPKHG